MQTDSGGDGLKADGLGSIPSSAVMWGCKRLKAGALLSIKYATATKRTPDRLSVFYPDKKIKGALSSTYTKVTPFPHQEDTGNVDKYECREDNFNIACL